MTSRPWFTHNGKLGRLRNAYFEMVYWLAIKHDSLYGTRFWTVTISNLLAA